MKKANRTIKTIFSLLLIVSSLSLALIGYYDKTLGEEFTVSESKKLTFSNSNCITVNYIGAENASSTFNSQGIEETGVTLKLFGVFPIKDVTVCSVANDCVYVLGTPFGVKLYSEGVMVVGLSKVKNAQGDFSPAEKAGIKIGDNIISVNTQEVTTNEELSSIIENSDGQPINLIISRDDNTLEITIQPVLETDTDLYKSGMWVRDSSAGIGTLTFYSPEYETVCGLGHGICDDDTNKLIKQSHGELVNAEILSCNMSSAGCPGQLVGRFALGTIGPLVVNNNCGVYGFCDENKFSDSQIMKLAKKQEVKSGKAQILSTVKGKKPKLYECEVTVRHLSNSSTQNLLVKVTDEELIKSTGGIVQGMSGSPIIQNGKLIGAVTHVLVDDPTKGYAIFAENMLETAQGVANKQMKEAS